MELVLPFEVNGLRASPRQQCCRTRISLPTGRLETRERGFIICVRLPTDPWPACLTQGRRLSRGLKNAFVEALIMKASSHTLAHKDKI